MEQVIPENYKGVHKSGAVLIIISLALFIVSNLWVYREERIFTLNVISMVITLLYLILLLVVRFRQSKKEAVPIPFTCWVNLVMLFTISAFSLNLMVRVFAEFPVWLTTYTLLSCAFFYLFPYLNRIPVSLRWVASLLGGATTVFTIYFLIYLAPLMPISLIGIIFFGLSLHTFVPAAWLALLIHVLAKKNVFSRGPFLAGILIPLLVLGVYLFKWYSLENRIKDIKALNNLSNRSELPDPIILAQQLPSDKLSEEILISPFYCQKFWGSGWGLEFDGEKKYHNPLAIMGNAFFGEVGIDYSTAMDILTIRKNNRHMAEERLWTGISLETGTVSTRIQLYPQFRFAYQEKVLTIHNSDKNRTDRAWFVTNTQQALYTFHVPEGTIVTSLSLWVNGVEQKSRLTTRNKADSAFKEIVGVQRRDPAIVHWKEGNRVIVSVFPCTDKEDRKFKIGFTSPLKYAGNNLVLENIWFEGPDAASAREVTEITCEQTDNFGWTQVPDRFEVEGDSKLTYAGDYNPDWEVSMKAPPLNHSEVSFMGKSYFISEEKDQVYPVMFKDVYLDVNSAWTESDLREVMNACKGKNVFILSSRPFKAEENKEAEIYLKHKDVLFSIPYLHKIKDPEQSLVVTKGTLNSPVLSDLKNSQYAVSLENWIIHNSGKLIVANIGEYNSPLYASLRELRLVRYFHIPLAELSRRISSRTWPEFIEDDNHLLLKESHLVLNRISDSKSESPSNRRIVASNGNLNTGLYASRDSYLAPAEPGSDHIIRLFAYTSILRKIGIHFFSSLKYENELLREAEEAYVVSPVSSLIVLESEEDYRKMGIDKNKDTLGNAEIMEGGAVPEPHEWALFTLLILMAVWLGVKDYKLKWK